MGLEKRLLALNLIDGDDGSRQFSASDKQIGIALAHFDP